MTARRKHLYGDGVAGNILTPFVLDLVERDAHQQVVDVVAAQVCVAVGGQNFEDAFMQAQNGNIERAAAQIVDRDHSVFALIESVGQRRGRRLIHQPQHFESRDAPGVLGGLPLRVVEVGGGR